EQDEKAAIGLLEEDAAKNEVRVIVTAVKPSGDKNKPNPAEGEPATIIIQQQGYQSDYPVYDRNDTLPVFRRDNPSIKGDQLNFKTFHTKGKAPKPMKLAQGAPDTAIELNLERKQITADPVQLLTAKLKALKEMKRNVGLTVPLFLETEGNLQY